MISLGSLSLERERKASVQQEAPASVKNIDISSSSFLAQTVAKRFCVVFGHTGFFHGPENTRRRGERLLRELLNCQRGRLIGSGRENPTLSLSVCLANYRGMRDTHTHTSHYNIVLNNSLASKERNRAGQFQIEVEEVNFLRFVDLPH